MPSSTAASAIWAACSMNWEGRYHDDDGRARPELALRLLEGCGSPLQSLTHACLCDRVEHLSSGRETVRG